MNERLGLSGPILCTAVRTRPGCTAGSSGRAPFPGGPSLGKAAVHAEQGVAGRARRGPPEQGGGHNGCRVIGCAAGAEARLQFHRSHWVCRTGIRHRDSCSRFLRSKDAMLTIRCAYPRHFPCSPLQGHGRPGLQQRDAVRRAGHRSCAGRGDGDVQVLALPRALRQDEAAPQHGHGGSRCARAGSSRLHSAHSLRRHTNKEQV